MVCEVEDQGAPSRSADQDEDEDKAVSIFPVSTAAPGTFHIEAFARKDDVAFSSPTNGFWVCCYCSHTCFDLSFHIFLFSSYGVFSHKKNTAAYCAWCGN